MQTILNMYLHPSFAKEPTMNQRIIYPTDDGGVAVIVPAEEFGLTIQ
jgi:hypothetical protein